MKKMFFYSLCCIFILVNCTKEGPIEESLVLENIYEIKDNSFDSIHQRVYQIYKNYKVPVYFNDTIGEVFIMNDVNGQPIYEYEKLDLAWKFQSTGNYKFDFVYMTDTVEMNRALDLIESYLEISDKALRPFSFFVAQSATRYNNDKVLEDYKKGKFEIGFRTVFLTGDWTDMIYNSLPEELMRQMVIDKILNYPEDIELFGNISSRLWYGGKSWASLTPGLRAGWTCDALYDTWWKGPSLTPEEWEEARVEARSVVGPFGFVWGHQRTRLQAPEDVEWDVKGFVQEILKHSPEEFEKLWGAYPLVMKKYNILHNVIVNELGVKL